MLKFCSSSYSTNCFKPCRSTLWCKTKASICRLANAGSLIQRDNTLLTKDLVCIHCVNAFITLHPCVQDPQLLPQCPTHHAHSMVTETYNDTRINCIPTATAANRTHLVIDTLGSNKFWEDIIDHNELYPNFWAPEALEQVRTYCSSVHTTYSVLYHC